TLQSQTHTTDERRRRWRGVGEEVKGEEEVRGEERKVTVVEELKEELQRFHQRREEEKRLAEYEAVKSEMERLQQREREQKAHTNTRNHCKRKSETRPETRSYRKRKIQASEGTIQRILLNSPSLLSSTAKSILSLVGSRSGEKEAVVVETKLKRGRKRLFKKDISSPLLTLSPHTTREGTAEKENKHINQRPL
ncbi:hypothetical protein CRUP_009269, partial [Coryphaenoides rupestris]